MGLVSNVVTVTALASLPFKYASSFDHVNGICPRGTLIEVNSHSTMIKTVSRICMHVCEHPLPQLRVVRHHPIRAAARSPARWRWLRA